MQPQSPPGWWKFRNMERETEKTDPSKPYRGKGTRCLARVEQQEIAAELWPPVQIKNHIQHPDKAGPAGQDPLAIFAVNALYDFSHVQKYENITFNTYCPPS